MTGGEGGGRGPGAAATSADAGAGTAEPAGDPRFAPPAVSLPRGGGAIQGIGEKFAANPVNGTGSLTIPLPISPGRAGFTPGLALAYDSGAGNGPYGYGWRIGYPAITRRTDRGLPQYLDDQDSDVFLLSGAEDLVPVLRPDGTRDEQVHNGYRVTRYRPRIEGTFARIERWRRDGDPSDVFWRTISGDNVTSHFGKTSASRIADPGNPARIFSWLLCESFDDKGNASVYEYIAEDGRGVDRGLPSEANRDDATRAAQRYLKRVKYGNRVSRLIAPDLAAQDWLFELVMDYGDHDPDAPGVAPSLPWPVRPDPFSTCRAGFEVRTYRRCQHVWMFHRFAELGPAPRLVRALELDYDDYADPAGGDTAAELAHPGSTRLASFLRRATAAGYADNGLRAALPPLELGYSRPRVVDEIRTLITGGDGLPAGVDGAAYQWIDLNGEGLSGVLSEQGRAWWYKPNLGDGQLGAAQRVLQRPSFSLGGGAQFLDLAGDGSLDLVQLARPVAGFFEHDAAGGWSAFQAFRSQPELDWHDPNLRLVDLTGDGLADVLITEDELLHWHPSLGEDGFGARRSLRMAADEARGPKLVFHDATETIFLADLSGDGLSDLVRIRNAQICYWPNLGYGRFGARVTMDGAPVLDTPERFDPRRIRLADIDGSGTVDLIYLAADGVRLYFNRAGNSWTAAYALRSFPRLDNTASVQVTDLLGNGTACLVWSSPLPGHVPAPLQFIDLMGGQKPHLLIGIENNLGARTEIDYVASTRFYLQDQQAGRPWITRLPFPVHVVERTAVYDEISGNRFVSRYTYHHGYYDGVERELRGFGMVEQIDTEDLAALRGDPDNPPPTNLDSASHAPPVLTRTWFHTGIYAGRDRVSRLYAGDYYREPGLSDAQAAQLLLDDTILPPGLSPDEEREACRALKGAMLRQEVYALDGTDQQPHPYVVTEQNLALQRLQPIAGNPHGVFFAHPRESIAYHYDRVPADPRVAHTLTLEVDELGNVLKSASVVYGRRQPDLALAPRDQAAQAALQIVYAEHQVSNPISTMDVYRTPLPSESRSYELTGLARAAGALRFTFDQLLAAGTGAAELAYEQDPVAGALQRRLVAHDRMLYRRDDLTAALPAGQLESLALPYESYKLAFTPGLVTRAYGSQITDAMLSADGGYVHLDDLQWWIPSGRVFYSPGAGDDPAAELANARQHWFLPRRYQDPFGRSTTVGFDAYDLLVAETRDAVANLTTVGERDAAGALVAPGHDYRVLQPRVVTDPNGNRRAASFDALGRIVGTAVMGKRDEVPRRGDLLDGFVADLPDAVIAAHLADPLAEPLAILARATTRVVYDLFAYVRTKRAARPAPAVVYALSRETHDADLAAGAQTRVQHGFAYSDGFGREIQRKAQAEPAPGATAPRWVGSGWTVFDNKGRPVRQFEPFFTATPSFEFNVRIGVSPILRYDPIGRLVVTIRPDHAWEKVIIDPWRQAHWDVHDTVLIADPALDPDVGTYFARLDDQEYSPAWYAQRAGGELGADDQTAAAQAAIHAATPSLAYADSLGRTFLTVAHNRFMAAGAAAGDPPTEERYATRVIRDIEGNQREVVDAADRSVLRGDYSMVGSLVHQVSMEAGERWMLVDVAGKPIHAFDSRGHHVRTEYDSLRRPLRSFVQGADPQAPAAEILFARTDYGEGHPDDTMLNLRTRVARQYDGAGVITNLQFDFKGNRLQTSRQFVQDYKAAPDWVASPALAMETFFSATSYDALDRPTSVTAPDASVYVPAFNEANLLERVDIYLRGAAAATAFVTNIDYDAKGQRSRIDYGNQVTTAYTYDPLTFRLVELATTRTTDHAILQDLRYTHDAAGNITQIRDAAQQTIYFNNQVVTADNGYVYDAVYRLIHADGREHIGQALPSTSPTTWNDQFRVHLPQPGDGQAMRRYQEDYRYDGIGNLLAFLHQAAGGNWSRSYDYDEPSLIDPSVVNNRLSRTTVGGSDPEPYAYDAHGNITAMLHLTVMQWNFRDQLGTTARQAVNDGSRETTYYVYDSSGRRTRKVTERQNGTRKTERIYLGGFEVYREYDASGATVSLERDSLHVMDDNQRIALVETKTVADGAPPGTIVSVIRYQLGNQLGSACVELDANGDLISYEEYFPYGSTSYQALNGAIEVSLKQYRYTGMERDEETGLSYHSARYYLPWLGRWLSADPGGPRSGPSLYCYCRGNPINAVDTNGRDPVAVGEAGDPDLPSPATAKRQDMARYAAKHGFDYTGPDPSPSQYHMTDKGGQWVVDAKYLKPHVYDAGDEYHGGFGTEPGKGIDTSDLGIIPTGPYQTTAQSGPKSAHAKQSSGGDSSRGRGTGKSSGSAASPTVISVAPPATSGGASTSPGTGNTGSGSGPAGSDGWLPSWVADVLEAALVVVLVVAAVATVAVFTTALLGALAVEGTTLGTAVTLAAGETIVGAGTTAAGVGAAKAVDEAATVEGEESAAIADGGYRIIDGTHRARAAVQLEIKDIDAEIFEGDKLVGTGRIPVDSLRSIKPVLDMSGKGEFRWLRALREMAAGESGPIKVTARPGGTPIKDVKIVRSRE